MTPVEDETPEPDTVTPVENPKEDKTLKSIKFVETAETAEQKKTPETNKTAEDQNKMKTPKGNNSEEVQGILVHKKTPKTSKLRWKPDDALLEIKYFDNFRV